MNYRIGSKISRFAFACWPLITFGILPSPGFAQNKTLGPGSCGLAQNNCHVNENNWWKDDAHKVTVDAFYDDPQAYEKIARLAGVDPGDMMKGTQTCMTCHGTVISGKEARVVEDGVSCESCHGPGSEYKDPHSEGDPNLGVNRPGYIKGLQLGMVELKNLDKRGGTCVRCHYITDQKLIAAGHPDGARFNYISGIKKVAKHWQRPPADNDLAKAPFEKAMQAKGPVAQIVKVEPAPAEPQPKPDTQTDPPPKPQAAPVAVQADPPPVAQVERQPVPAPAPVRSPITRSMPLAPKASPAPTQRDAVSAPPENGADAAAPPGFSVGRIDLPPFPNVSDTMSVEQILVILKKRLELLYQKTGGN